MLKKSTSFKAILHFPYLTFFGAKMMADLYFLNSTNQMSKGSHLFTIEPDFDNKKVIIFIILKPYW